MRMRCASPVSRATMPKVKDLISYYDGAGEELMESKGIEDYMFINSKTPACMACGRFKKIQRAHILPVCEGGDNSLSNIHLLCAGCHGESENLSGEKYWNWMRHVNSTEYKCWILRMFDKFKLETGKEPTSENIKKEWGHVLNDKQKIRWNH